MVILVLVIHLELFNLGEFVTVAIVYPHIQ